MSIIYAFKSGQEYEREKLITDFLRDLEEVKDIPHVIWSKIEKWKKRRNND